MKINTPTRHQGSALLLALLTAFVICIALTTYLYLVSNQNRSVMRSMAWNSSIPVVEAGVEEALTQANYAGPTNLAANGWSPLSADGFFHKYNDLGNGFAYDVGVKPPLATGPDQPTIESIGYAPAPANIASYYSSPWGMILGGLVPQFTPDRPSAKRKVRVLAKRQTPVQYAMLAKGQIDLHGNNVATDSFNSTNTSYSTNGKYDKARSRDHGDIATNAGIVDGVNAGNANIKGHASTGPDGSVAIGSSGTIGDKAWVDGGNKGVQAGHVVVSNSRNHRMERDVPLLVPEINPDHLKLVSDTAVMARSQAGAGELATTDHHGGADQPTLATRNPRLPDHRHEVALRFRVIGLAAIPLDGVHQLHHRGLLLDLLVQVHTDDVHADAGILRFPKYLDRIASAVYPAAESTSSVCWPRAGAVLLTDAGVPLSSHGTPSVLYLPIWGWSSSCTISMAAI